MNGKQSKTSKPLTWTLVLGATALLSACAGSGGAAPQDVGSMALPTSSLSGGSIESTVSRSTTFDTGNMAYPEPLPQGVTNRTASRARSPDTGNMAFPDPLPQGQLASSPRQ